MKKSGVLHGEVAHEEDKHTGFGANKANMWVSNLRFTKKWK